MRRPSDRKPLAGFTLIELLVVVVIAGILVTIAAPRVGAMLSGGSLRVGAREFAAACRYARAMALLNQTPVDLTFTQSGAGFSVNAREITEAGALGMSDIAAFTNDVGYTESLIGTSARRRASLTGGFGIAVSREERDDIAFKRGVDAGDTMSLLGVDGEEIEDTVSFADTINMSRKIDGVKLFFDEFTDRVETRSAWFKISGGPASVNDGDSVTIRFRANGTVRPCRIKVVSDKDENDYMTVFINSVGAVRIAATREEEKE